MVTFNRGLNMLHKGAMQFIRILTIAPYHYAMAVNYQDKTKAVIILLATIYLPLQPDLFHVLLMTKQTHGNN